MWKWPINLSFFRRWSAACYNAATLWSPSTALPSVTSTGMRETMFHFLNIKPTHPQPPPPPAQIEIYVFAPQKYM